MLVYMSVDNTKSGLRPFLRVQRKLRRDAGFVKQLKCKPLKNKKKRGLSQKMHFS